MCPTRTREERILRIWRVRWHRRSDWTRVPRSWCGPQLGLRCGDCWPRARRHRRNRSRRSSNARSSGPRRRRMGARPPRAAAGGAGLAAATVGGVPNPPPLPPIPRLRPPRSAGWALAGLAACALVLMISGSSPTRGAVPEPYSSPARPMDATGEAPDRAGGETVRDPSARPKALHQALNLPPGAPLDHGTVTERLKDPAIRQAVAEAAVGDPVARVVASGDTPAAEAARAVLEADAAWAAEAEEARRRAAQRAAAFGAAEVPAHRRRLATAYADLLRKGRGGK